MRFTCWITKATDAHLEYVILVAFQLQKWLQESALILGYAIYMPALLCNIYQHMTVKHKSLL